MNSPLLSSARVVVVGTSAIGKSSFSTRLAAALRVPRVELDALYWSHNWQPKPTDEFICLVKESTSGTSWVVDGNYGSARDHIWDRATHIVWLNYSLPVNLWRGLKRTAGRCFSREVLWHGNRESFRRSFMSKESILVWIYTTHERRRRELSELRDTSTYRALSWHEFQTPSQAEAWLRHVESAA